MTFSTGCFLDIHGHDQWVTIRGADRANPAVMILGGAGAGLTALAPLFEPWERTWTVIQWDQPGAGWTAARNGPGDALTYDRLARDGLAVVEAVLQRLGHQRLVLFALSGGTIPGLKMIRARPDLFHAYVAQGQITRWARQEAESYRMVLARAREAGDAAAVAELERIGPPPWADVAADAIRGQLANAFTPAERAATPPGLMGRVHVPPADASWRPQGLSPVDSYATALAAFEALKPQLTTFDAEALGHSFLVPMLFFQGAQDAHTPAAEVAAYAATIEAPLVHLEMIPDAGHSAIFMAERLLALLDRYVQPLTSARRRP